MKKIAAVFAFCIFALPASLAFATLPDKGEVTVQDDWRSCSKNEECTLADTLCSNCCGYVGIGKINLDSFLKLKTQFCPKDIAPCKCSNSFNIPVCIQNKCDLANKDGQTAEGNVTENPTEFQALMKNLEAQQKPTIQ